MSLLSCLLVLQFLPLPPKSVSMDVGTNGLELQKFNSVLFSSFFKESVDRVEDVGNPHDFRGSKHLHGPLNAT